MPIKTRFVGFNTVFIVLLVLIVASLHFHGSFYRYDEAWFVDAAQSQTVSNSMALSLTRLWIGAFGAAEPITRWLAVLLFALALALVAQLSKVLLGRKTMWIAPAILGSIAIVLEFSGRSTLYTLPMIASTGLLLLFWRMLRQSRWGEKLAYLLCAVLMSISYPIGLIIIPLQLIFVIFTTVSTRRSQYLIWLTLSAVIGLGIAVITGFGQDNVLLAVGSTLVHFTPKMALVMRDRLQLLLLGGLAVIGITHTWRENTRRTAYIAWLLGGLLVVNALLSDGQIQTNFLALLVPLFVILAIQGLLLFNRPLRLLIALGSIAFTLSLIQTNRMTTAPYTTLASQIPNGAGVVIASPDVWQQTLPRFYINQRTTNDDIFHMVQHFEARDAVFLSAAPSHIATSSDATSTQQFMNWTQAYNEIWYVEDGLLALNNDFHSQLQQVFAPVTYINWHGESATTSNTQTAIRYLRIPADLADMFKFGDQFWLQKWTLQNDVNASPCQSITVQSWWKLHQPPQNNYSLSLTLVDAQSGQGVVRADSALGASLTLLWQTNQAYFDERSLTLPCDLPAGDYPLLFSVHTVDANADHLLPVTQTDGAPLGEQLYLTTLHVGNTP